MIRAISATASTMLQTTARAAVFRSASSLSGRFFQGNNNCYASSYSPSPLPFSFPFQTNKRSLSSSSSSFDVTSSSSETNSAESTSTVSVDETLNKLFSDSQQQLAEANGDAWFAAAETTTAAAGSTFEPVWYNLADQAIVVVDAFHNLSGLEYGWSIVGVTTIMRLALFPLMVRTQQTTSRMAHLQPELQQMKSRYEAMGTPSRQDQLNFGKNMKALFSKYQVNPFWGFAAPLAQLPLFMGMFFGLKKIPNIFPEKLVNGGMFWFPDLTAPDPLYILPFATAGSFLLLCELGKDQMMATNPDQGRMFVNIMRGTSLIMLPVCINFEASMLCYWTANNALSIAQSAVLKSPVARKYFGIWERPKPVPGQPAPESLKEAATGLMNRLQGKPNSEKERIRLHNQAIENKNQAVKLLRGASNNRAVEAKNQAVTLRRGASNKPKGSVGITGTRNR